MRGLTLLLIIANFYLSNPSLIDNELSASSVHERAYLHIVNKIVLGDFVHYAAIVKQSTWHGV